MPKLFSSFLGLDNLIPHGFCLSWNPVLLWMHVVSDVLISLSYYSIPLSLAYFVRKRGNDLPYSWLVTMGSVFIVACGTTHLMSVVLIWIPLYWLDGYLKVITAIVSVATALAMLRIIPLALKLQTTKQLEIERDGHKEALRRLTEIAKNVPGVVYQFRLNADGTSCFSYASPAIQTIYRVNPDDVKENAEKVFAILHPDDYDSVVAGIKASAENLTTWKQTYRVRFEDGVERWLFGHALPTRQADGSTLWHGFITDVTEQKRLQIALTTENLKNAAFLHNASDGIVIMDTDGKIVECSDSFYDMLGYSRAEIIGMHVSQWDAAIPENELTNLVNAQFEKPFIRRQFESRHIRKDGTIYYAEISCCAIELDDKPLLFTSTRDISEHKQLEKKLVESEFLWKFAVEGSGDGLWDWNLEDNSVFFSKAWKKMLGFSNDEIGNNLDEWEKRIHPDDVAVVMIDVNNAIDGVTRVYKNEHRVLCKDGSYKWILDRGVVVSRNSSGKALRMIGTHEDIHERKQLEKDLLHSKKVIEDLYNNAPCGYHSLDKNGIITNINNTELNWLGFSRDDVIGKKITDFYTAEGKELFKKNYPLFLAKGHIENLEYDFINKNGNGGVRCMSLSATAINDEAGNFIKSRAAVYDITELKVIQNALYQLTLEQQIILDNELVGIVKLRNRRIIWANVAMAKIFGYEKSEFVDQSTRFLFTDDETYESFGKEVYSSINSTGICRTQFQFLSKNGKKIWVDINGQKVAGDNLDSLWIMRDITEQKKYQDQVEHIAFHDFLTELPNRLLVTDRLDQALVRAERTEKMLAICYLDLDGFKPVNDKFGHGAGDKLLIEIANRMELAVRGNDTVGRLGGDEFVLILNDLESEEECKIILQRVIELINEPIEISEQTEVKVGASIGVSLYPNDMSSPEILLRHADYAMYQAKKLGRNRTHFY